MSRTWLLAGGVLLLAAGVAARRLFVLEVAGQSMEPSLHAGDRLLVLRTRRVGPGDVVVVRQPTADGRWQPPGGRAGPLLVKRVAGAECGVGRLLLLGDNPGRSWDSRQLGPCPSRWVVGRVVAGL